MGRKAKVAEAIPVPHDGFLNHHVMVSKEKLDGKSPGAQEAVAILTNGVGDDKSSYQHRFWTTLTTASQNRDQMQALQAYRSNLLQRPDHDTVQLIGIYRILLELSLSCKTNQPLRRAIQPCLATLDGILGSDATSAIQVDVVGTLWDPEYWENPLQTLFEALNFAPTKLIIADCQLSNALQLLVNASQSVSDVLERSSFHNKNGENLPNSEVTEAAVELTTEIATTAKLLMTHLLLQEHQKGMFEAHLDVFKELQLFLWKGIVCSTMHADGLSKLGVAYGQTLLVTWIGMTPELIRESVIQRIQQVVSDTSIPPLHTLCTVQGITVVLPDEVLMQGSPVTLLEEPIASYLLLQCSEATDGSTRLSSLRSLQTLLSRCSSIVKKGDTSVISKDCLTYVDKLTQETLQIVMTAWENPPGRQVASAIPGLFNSLVDLIETIHPKQEKAASGIQGLVGRVLAQPVNRKGRYIALETLLPIVGAKALIDSGGNQLIGSLVTGVGDRAHTAGTISALLGKILSKRREEMNEEAGLVVDEANSMNKKQRRKREQLLARNPDAKVEPIKSQLLPDWIELWAPHFARGLLSKTHVRRKQISAFCIPLLMTIVGGSSRRTDASFALSSLFAQLQKEYENQKVAGAVMPVVSHDAETFDDIFLWAKLEIARQATAQKLISTASIADELTLRLKEEFGEEVLRSALTHSSPRVRLVAFAAMEAAIPALDSVQTKLEAAKVEMGLWKLALPYAFKSSGKEYTAALLVYLTAFLDRLALAEAKEFENSETECRILPYFSSFIDEFLIDDIIMKQAAYPGTVLEKESFAISLLECVMSFAIRDDLTSISCKSFQLPGQTERRQTRTSEHTTLQCVSEKLISAEVLLMLLGLCHSIWDSTRGEAFKCLTSLAQAAHKKSICLPTQFRDKSVITRGIFLSSSPRQRESDTGAIILAFACSVKAEHDARENFLVKLVSLLKDRIRTMNDRLREILAPSSGTASAVTQRGLSLPLAHGLIQSVRLIMGMNDIDRSTRFCKDVIVELVTLCCEAIQVSLSVVADLKDNPADKELEIDDLTEQEDYVPLNVNTGAIGANATFASLKGNSKADEAARRFATQRVVMGSWLLTKEACATLASAITYDPVYVPGDIIENAGKLLITTMTALKHQGAAFAAQKSLQQISNHCNSKLSASILRAFPSEWSDRLLSEISSLEKVRDSTLRRSTGYGLGFLALMRPELSVKGSPRILCPRILSSLVLVSLPPKFRIEEHMSKLGLAQDVSSLFSNTLRSRREGLVFTSVEEATSRVHALNVLRLIILDAPLATEVAPFIGDCIVSALIGYTDETWAVRNSATMVFSAAMLRVVDADKNAIQKDETSCNAITAVEFFRQHSSLKTFLLAMLKYGMHDVDGSKVVSIESSHSPVFLVLLLLARMQPVRNSDNEAAAFTDSFVPHVIASLAHSDLKVRIIAARALANIRSDDPNSESHANRVVDKCIDIINMSAEGWNSMHGALIGIHEIFKTLPNPSLGLESTGVRKCVVELCKKEPPVAPSCLSVAVEIWSMFLQGDAASTSKVEDLTRFCLRLISEHENRNLYNSQIVGEATLCTTLGRVASEHLSKLLWTQLDDVDGCLGSLKELFVSSIIDTRLVATKVFKKSIYKRIDELLLATVPSSAEKVLRLKKASQMLLESLKCEVRRAVSENRLGAHPPTVRRLSRCLLECLNAARALGSEAFQPQELWEVSRIMIQDGSQVDPDDTVMGNVAEIMGFFIAASRDDEDMTARLNSFVSLITKLNDQWGPWRVRHGVALAIDTSGLLTTENTATRFTLQLQVLKLLQDNDPDVRYIAACSMTRQGNSPGSSAALFALERAYISMGKTDQKTTLDKYLLESLAQKYENVENRMEQICDEMNQSESNSDEALLNTNTTRKIFEDEDPNSYEEPLLACHLAVVTLANSSKTLNDSHNVVYTNLLQLATFIVKTLHQRYVKQHGVLYDVTRNIILFPDIHGVLLSCIVIIYLGGSPNNGLQEEVLALIGLCHDSASLHPGILEALKVLASAKSGDDTTRDSLLRLCFLVPSRLVK